MTQSTGKVYLIGAGPGDPGLITVKGLECVKKADVIIYDYLANERLLDHRRLRLPGQTIAGLAGRLPVR